MCKQKFKLGKKSLKSLPLPSLPLAPALLLSFLGGGDGVTGGVPRTADRVILRPSGISASGRPLVMLSASSWTLAKLDLGRPLLFGFSFSSGTSTLGSS